MLKIQEQRAIAVEERNKRREKREREIAVEERGVDVSDINRKGLRVILREEN